MLFYIFATVVKKIYNYNNKKTWQQVKNKKISTDVFLARHVDARKF